MKKVLIAALFLFVTSFSFPINAAAATPKKANHQLQQAKVQTQYFNNLNTVSIWFTSLRDVKTIQYTLSYKSQGVAQGVSGTIQDETFKNHSNVFRRIQLATCSSTVCLNHKNITDFKLEVTITYKNGKVTTKTYDLGRRFERDHEKKCDWD